MKKLIKVMWVFMLGFTLSTQVLAQTATPPAAGDGSQAAPYQIATLNNLYWLSQTTSEWDKYFIQTDYINATTTNSWDGGAGFSPIGNATTPFTGSYDGRFYAIYTLAITRFSTDYVALFGFVSGATIKNIALTNCQIIGGAYTGSLVGSSTSPLSNIENCSAKGTVLGLNHTGGLVGRAVSLNILNSYSRCYVAPSDPFSTVEHLGGLLGSTTGVVENCYSTGPVSSTTNINVGGLIGSESGATITHCYWDMGTSYRLTSAGGEGKTTAEMTTQGTFEGWDFTNTWLIDNIEPINDGYPFLNPTTPAPPVPVSDWALYLGVLLMGAFVVTRYLYVNVA